MRNYNYLEEELEKVQAVCSRYGFKATLRFDELHIKTKMESWYFIPSEGNTAPIKLMHKNAGASSRNLRKEGYHKQFTRCISYEDLIRYIAGHENYRYKSDPTAKMFAKLYAAQAACH